MNDDNKIRDLLGRFYQGATTEAEEQELRRLLAHSPADEFMADKALSEAMEKTIEVPDDLEKRLNDAIDSWDAAGRDSAVTVHRLPRRSVWMRVSGIAASVAILICGGLFFYRSANPRSQQPADSFSDPAEAYTAAQEALTIFADALNKGMAEVEFVRDISDKTISTAIEEINRPNSHPTTES